MLPGASLTSRARPGAVRVFLTLLPCPPFFSQWVGPKVSKLATSKAIPTKSAIFSYFQGHHLALEIYDRESLSEADIEKRLRAAGGAHQPSDMQFPGGGRAVATSDVVAAAGGGTPIAAGGSTPVASAAQTSSAAPAVLKAFGGSQKVPAAVPAKAASASGSSASVDSSPKAPSSEAIAFAKVAAAEAAAAVASGDLASAAAAVAAVVAALERC